MQLTNSQKFLARQELLEMLAAHPDGLLVSQLRATKSFCKDSELTDKQVEQLLHASPPVVEVQLKLGGEAMQRIAGVLHRSQKTEKFYKLTDAGLRVIAALSAVQGKP
jgi:hypothetical protein